MHWNLCQVHASLQSMQMANKTKHRLAARPASPKTVKACATLSKTPEPNLLSQKKMDAILAQGFLLVVFLHSRETCYASPRMGDSTGRVGPVHSWSASTRRTLAGVNARGLNGRIETVAASSGTGSGSWAAEREPPGSSVPPEVTIAAAKKSRGGCYSSRSSGHWTVQKCKFCERASRKTEAFLERARKRPATRASVGRGRRSTLSVAGSCWDTGSCSATCTRGTDTTTQI